MPTSAPPSRRRVCEHTRHPCCPRCMLPVIITVVAPRLPGHLVGRLGARRPGEADSCAAVQRRRAARHRPGGCPPSPNSTGTRSRRTCSTTPQPPTSARLDARVASPTPPISLLASNGPRVSRGPPARTSRLWAPSAATGPWRLPARAAGKPLSRSRRGPPARSTWPSANAAERSTSFAAPARRRLDRHGAARIVRRVARRAGLAKKIGPHTLLHAFITAALDAGRPAAGYPGSRLARRPAVSNRRIRASPRSGAIGPRQLVWRSVPPGTGGRREGWCSMRLTKLVIAATALVASRTCVPLSCALLFLLYFAAVLAPDYLLRNSKIIRLAGRAMVSNRRPLAC